MLFATARNAKTGLYEVHKDGCAHLNFPFMEVCTTGKTAASGDALAREQAAGNDGCAFTTGPCVQRGKHLVHFLDEENGWALTSLPRSAWGA